MVDYRILQGRCEDFLRGEPAMQVDVAFLDPPYNTGNTVNKAATYDQNKELAAKRWSSFYADWDTIDDYTCWACEWLTYLRPVMKPKGAVFVCGSYHNAPEIGVAAKAAGYYIVTHIPWCIPNAFPNLSMTRMVAANQSIYWLRPYPKRTHYYDKEAAKRYNDGKNLRDYWIIPKESQRKRPDKPWLAHKSKKPVPLMERAIDITLPKVSGGHVLDFFAGSGSTGEAVWNLARRYGLDLTCTLVDCSPEYVASIHARINWLRAHSLGS
jgi:DNA modification methylase